MSQSTEVAARNERHAKVGDVKERLLARIDDFERALSDIIPPDTFVQTALTAVTENEDLLKCTSESILLASLKAAQAGLRLDGRQAALVPYKRRATFMPMVQGVLDLIARSPNVGKVEARAVREGDEFSYQYGTEPEIVHRPSSRPTGEREVTYSYGVVWWNNGAPPTFEVVDRDEIEQARNTSRAPNSPAWRNWYGEMARKVAVHRLSKYVDLAPDTAKRIGKVMEAEWAGIQEQRSRRRSPRETEKFSAEVLGSEVVTEPTLEEWWERGQVAAAKLAEAGALDPDESEALDLLKEEEDVDALGSLVEDLEEQVKGLGDE